MPNIKGPILSLAASGTLSKAITYLKRRGRNIAEKKPEIIDVKSAGQLSWRHMFLKCTALWYALSTAEQAEWESLARPKHMTGYAYWQSQCLRPNPGIYLPLQGGTMQGDIDMAKYRILKLPAPSDAQEAFRLSEYITYVLPYLLKEGARVYHNIDQSIPHNTWTDLAFNSQRWDTDTIHDTVTNNSRLICKTTGRYLIIANFNWEASAVGYRIETIRLNDTTTIFYGETGLSSQDIRRPVITTIWNMSIGDYVEVSVKQTSGGALLVTTSLASSPEFIMERLSA